MSHHPSEESIRRITREEISSQWAYDQFYRRIYGVGQPVYESTLSHYVRRNELDTILDRRLSDGIFKEVYRLMATHTGINELFNQYRMEMDQSLRSSAKTIESESIRRLERSRDRIINDVLRTDDGNRIINEVERRVGHGPGFYIGIIALSLTAGFIGGASSRLIPSSE
jgi:hypothetical protein